MSRPHETATRTLVAAGMLRVPEITALFWLIKGLSTAMGEATSDYLVSAINPIVAVIVGFAGFVVSMIIQFSMRRYVAWAYWLAVVMVGVFGTMVADVLHVGFGVPYTVTAPAFAVILAAVFSCWRAVEGTLSIHSIDTPRRETFYWLAVVATFALGTALGDFAATTLHWGYALSTLVFAVVILIPAVGFRWLRFNAVFAFWFAYVVTRPLGASTADWLGKPTDAGGLGLGQGPVALALTMLIAVLVAYLTVTRRDVQRPIRRGRGA